jgi:hypothetical protein
MHGLLHELHGRVSILGASLYADDEAVFVAPIKDDIHDLGKILELW